MRLYRAQDPTGSWMKQCDYTLTLLYELVNMGYPVLRVSGSVADYYTDDELGGADDIHVFVRIPSNVITPRAAFHAEMKEAKANAESRKSTMLRKKMVKRGEANHRGKSKPPRRSKRSLETVETLELWCTVLGVGGVFSFTIPRNADGIEEIGTRICKKQVYDRVYGFDVYTCQSTSRRGQTDNGSRMIPSWIH